MALCMRGVLSSLAGRNKSIYKTHKYKKEPYIVCESILCTTSHSECRDQCCLHRVELKRVLRLHQDFQGAPVVCNQINVWDHKVWWEFLDKVSLYVLYCGNFFICPLSIHAVPVMGKWRWLSRKDFTCVGVTSARLYGDNLEIRYCWLHSHKVDIHPTETHLKQFVDTYLNALILWILIFATQRFTVSCHGFSNHLGLSEV